MVRQSLRSSREWGRQPTMPLNPSQCVPLGCSWSNKDSKPSAFEMQWALTEKLSLQRNFQTLVGAKTLAGKRRKDYTIEEVSSQYLLEKKPHNQGSMGVPSCRVPGVSYIIQETFQDEEQEHRNSLFLL